MTTDRLLDAARAVAIAVTVADGDYYILHPCCNSPEGEQAHHRQLLKELVAAVQEADE